MYAVGVTTVESNTIKYHIFFSLVLELWMLSSINTSIYHSWRGVLHTTLCDKACQ